MAEPNKGFRAEIDTLRINNRYLRLTSGLLVVLCIILALGWNRSIGLERTILVPPELHKTVWINTDDASKDYLEELAYYLSTISLSVTPESAKYQGETLMKFAAPEDRGALQVSIDLNLEKLRANNASTVFHPAAIKYGEGLNKLKVIVEGRLTTFIADKKLNEEQKSYLIDFAYRGTTLYLKTLKEVNPIDPFNPNSILTNTNTILLNK